MRFLLLALLFVGFVFVLSNNTQAENLAEECDSNILESCASLGENLAFGLNSYQAAPGMAVVPLRRACEGGIAQSCTALGVLFADGRGIGADEDEAKRLFLLGCEGDDAKGCYHYGAMFHSPSGRAGSDNALAFRYYQKGCALGSSISCILAEGM